MAVSPSTENVVYWLILGGAGALFFGVLGWGMWRDRKDEKEGKKD